MTKKIGPKAQQLRALREARADGGTNVVAGELVDAEPTSGVAQRAMPKAHPYSALFPMLSAAELDDLAADVAANGLIRPIVMHEGLILDGRNRDAACRKAKVKPRFETYTGNDPLSYVISCNLKRRHLNASQRGLIGAKLAQLPPWRPSKQSPPNGGLTAKQAASMINIGERTIERGRVVLESGSTKLIKAIEDGEIDLGVAARIVKQDKAAQDAVVARVLDGEKAVEAHRVVKSAEIVKRQLASPRGKYRVIYADPPWDYGQHRMPDEFGEPRDHYPCMSLDEICDIPVDEWAEDDAVLFLWVTVPFALKVAPVIRDWGFDYKTELIWHKMQHVMGHYSSVRHEKLYVCTRGACQPDVRKLFDSVQSIKVPQRRHSAKPSKFYDIIETLYPQGRRLELFHRGATKRRGWDCWGLESLPRARSSFG